MSKSLFFMPLFALLANCASPEQIAMQQDEYCTSIGAAPGSPEYMQCRLIVEQQRQNRQIAAGQALTGIGIAMMNQQ